MSEQAAEATQEAPDTAVDEASETETDWKTEAEKWKSLSRKNEDAAKANATKAKEYDAFLESQKTEQQKSEEAAKQLAADRAVLASENAKLKAALKHGLSDEDLELLGDGTPEQIETRAEKLAARLGDRKPAVPSSSSLARVNQNTVKSSTGDQFADFFSTQLSS